MKRLLTVAIFIALLAPAAAFAKAEFTLGGYVKMAVIWDSTQINKNLLAFAPRNNDLNNQHGRLKFTAENTRMHFTIKGPNLWGAKTMAYIEFDFDNNANQLAGWESPHKARPGLRHAFFRFNWPETELLMGSYWSILTEEVPETANFGACTTAGQPFTREPQIRLTQMFGLGGGKLTASVALAQPMNGLWGLAINTNQTNANNQFTGESSETPKVEGRLKYDIDLWGKAAFWGRPRPFSVRLAAAWWRERFRGFTPAATPGATTFGQNGYAALVPGVDAALVKQEYMTKYLAEVSMFVPILATHTKNLAGTASLLTQWWIGQGLDAWFEDFPNNASYLNLDRIVGTGPFGSAWYCDREEMKRFGGFVQLQYYFTNQWFVDAVWGLNKAYGVNRGTWIGETGADPVFQNQHYYLTLWYRPIQAVKFGLEYTYVHSDYFQKTTPTANARTTDLGENHRVMFAGYYYF
jgi:hypothetical protein